MITGYKTSGGSYVTKAEAIKRHANAIKDAVNNRQKYYDKLEKQEQLTASAIHEEFKAQETYKQQQEIHALQCRQFVSYAAEFYTNYAEYITAWDIAHGDLYGVQDNINRNKITLDAVKYIYNTALTFIDDLNLYIDGLKEV